MRGKILWPAAALLVLFSVAPARPGGAETKVLEENPKGWVFVDEDISKALSKEPGFHFRLAREAFLRKDRKGSAAELRTAAAFLKLETGRATEEGKSGLLSAASRLDDLADGVETGRVSSVRELDEAFEAAHAALASHHYRKAEESWRAKETEKLSHDVDAAASHLERAYAWTKQKAGAGEKRAAEEAHLLAEKLRKGRQATEEEVGKVLKALGGEIAGLGKKLAPEPR